MINSSLHTKWEILQLLLTESHVVCRCVLKLRVPCTNQYMDSSNQSRDSLTDTYGHVAPCISLDQTFRVSCSDCGKPEVCFSLLSSLYLYLALRPAKVKLCLSASPADLSCVAFLDPKYTFSALYSEVRCWHHCAHPTTGH